jgi:isopropylmalate/homocitrate/citramalate synthase
MTGHKTRDWFTSPWNRCSDVALTFPPKITLHDVSLRDGEQQAGVSFKKDEKIRLAEMLAEAGVHRLEAGMPAVHPEDEAALREIVRRVGQHIEVFAFARCIVEDIRKAADVGASGVTIEIPASEHIVQKAYGWSLEKALDLSIEASALAGELGLRTVFFPIDSSRADIDWVINLFEQVIRHGHADAVTLVDTFGVLGPHAVGSYVRRIKERINKPLEVHFHDDFRLSVANTIMALAAGAEVAHTTVSAIGERAGNTPYEDLTLALLTLYGVDLGIDTTKFHSISRYVQQVAPHRVPTNRSVVGDRIFDITSGIIAGWYEQCGEEDLTELFPYRPELVGHPGVEVLLGKMSGLANVDIWCRRLGLDLTEDERQVLLSRIKDRGYERKGLIEPGEFIRLVEELGFGRSRGVSPSKASRAIASR